MRRDETQVDEARLLVAQRLDKPRFLVGPRADRQDPKVRSGLGRQRGKRPADDLVVDGLIDLERQAKAGPEEPVLLVDASRPGHEGRVTPDRHDRRLDRAVFLVGRRPTGADDQAIQAGNVAGRTCQATAHIDQSRRVEACREPTEHDAQDHPARNDTPAVEVPPGRRGVGLDVDFSLHERPLSVDVHGPHQARRDPSR